MRLNKIHRVRQNISGGSGEQLVDFLRVEVSEDGEVIVENIPVPIGWDSWDQATKVQWTKDQTQLLLTAQHHVHGEHIYSNFTAVEAAIASVKVLPGWSTWTPDEAVAWVQLHSTSTNDFRALFEVMTRMLILLRDIVIER